MKAVDPSLRHARPADLAALCALSAQCFDAPWHADNFLEEFALSEGRVWLLLDSADTPAGYLVARRILDEFHILSLGVAPELRRQGLGVTLIERALAEEAGVARVLLEVREANAGARRFYAALGFAEVGQRANYYPEGDAAVLLTLALPKEEAVAGGWG